MIRITDTIGLDEREVVEEFIRASGPGGQNVNKVSSAVQLRFDLGHSSCLPEEVRTRVMQLAGRRLTREGHLIITARRFRTQHRNRLDAWQRLIALIREGTSPPRERRRTRPSRAALSRRREERCKQSLRKARRAPVGSRDRD